MLIARRQQTWERPSHYYVQQRVPFFSYHQVRAYDFFLVYLSCWANDAKRRWKGASWGTRENPFRTFGSFQLQASGVSSRIRASFTNFYRTELLWETTCAVSSDLCEIRVRLHVFKVAEIQLCLSHIHVLQLSQHWQQRVGMYRL